MKPKFDGYAAQYDAWFMENDNLFQSELRLFQTALGDIAGKRVLSVGCGSGLFESMIDCSSIEGIEPSHDMGAIAQKRGVNVIVTALEMPLELESNDDAIRTRLYPMFGRKLAPEVCGLFDVVARVEVSTKPGHEGERFLRMDGDDRIMAKNRYGTGKFATADLGALFSAIEKALIRGEVPTEGGKGKETAPEQPKGEDEAKGGATGKDGEGKETKKSGRGNRGKGG